MPYNDSPVCYFEIALIEQRVPLEKKARSDDRVGEISEVAHLDDQAFTQPCRLVADIGLQPARRLRRQRLENGKAAVTRCNKPGALVGRDGMLKKRFLGGHARHNKGET